MTNIKHKHYRVKRNGRGFWEPTAKMRALGFVSQWGTHSAPQMSYSPPTAR